MTLRREHLGPSARAFYDQQAKAQPARSAIATRVRKGQRGSKSAAVEFLNICEKGGLPAPQLEYRFHPVRMWRFDAAFVREKIAIEINGGTWIGGGHNSGVGSVEDMEKSNAACRMGWRILRYTPQQFLEAETVADVKASMRANMRGASGR